jgi:hypothetical protein
LAHSAFHLRGQRRYKTGLNRKLPEAQLTANRRRWRSTLQHTTSRLNRINLRPPSVLLRHERPSVSFTLWRTVEISRCIAFTQVLEIYAISLPQTLARSVLFNRRRSHKHARLDIR